MARGAAALGWSVRQVPLSDGGEGLLDALAGPDDVRERVEVEGPLGRPVTAEWLRIGDVAVVEMAQASGLALAGGAEGNDPMGATTRGTGQLIVAAARRIAGMPARRHAGTVVVGLGGSATTDGGLGALSAIEEAGGLGDVELVGACDVVVGFLQAPSRFGPQKGADPAQVRELEGRLDDLARTLEGRYGVDVRDVAGTGAAGGLGGAIVALGGRLRSGYEVVSELVGLSAALSSSQMVMTGEGAFDATSLLGKVVGSVLGEATRVGDSGSGHRRPGDPRGRRGGPCRGRIGGVVDRAVRSRNGPVGDTTRCIEQAVAECLGRRTDRVEEPRHRS